MSRITPKGVLFLLFSNFLISPFHPSLSPCELYERKVTAHELRAALAALPEMQSHRVYAHYILGMSKTEIARKRSANKFYFNKSATLPQLHYEGVPAFL